MGARHLRTAALVALMAGSLTIPSTAAGAGPHCDTSVLRKRQLGSLPRGTGEVSGLAASHRYPGVGWMIRDSGNPPSLYTLRLAGGAQPRVREIPVLGAENRDWEDLAYGFGPDGKGRLWIIESTQSHRDPYIYEVVEPHPAARVVPLRARYRYAYPGGRVVNTEVSFMSGGNLVMVTKTAPARVYRFGRLSTTDVNRPRFVGELRGMGRPSMARLSPDGRLLVAADHDTMVVYRARSVDASLSAFVGRDPSHRRMFAPGDNVESGDFFPGGSCDLLMLSESRSVYRLLRDPAAP